MWREGYLVCWGGKEEMFLLSFCSTEIIIVEGNSAESTVCSWAYEWAHATSCSTVPLHTHRPGQSPHSTEALITSGTLTWKRQTSQKNYRKCSEGSSDQFPLAHSITNNEATYWYNPNPFNILQWLVPNL